MARTDQTYSEAQVREKLADLPGWDYDDGWLRRTYRTDGWPTTLMLVNAIGFIAEAADHHPDLTVSWGQVDVRLQNHAAGGVSDKDLELARLIERQALWRPEGGALTGTRKQWVRADTSK